MWPVFLRVTHEGGIPNQLGSEGEIVFLGCILEVFHMRLRTQNDVSACLSAIADVRKGGSFTTTQKADRGGGHAAQPNSELKGTPQQPLAETIGQVEVEYQREAGSECECPASTFNESGNQEQRYPELRGRPVPQIFFQPAPSLAGTAVESRESQDTVTLPFSNREKNSKEAALDHVMKPDNNLGALVC